MNPTDGAALLSLRTPADALVFLAVIAALAALAAYLRHAAGFGSGRETLWVTLRATVQLLVVGLLIAAVLDSWWWTAGFVALMVVVAARTSHRRLGAAGSATVWLLIGAIALGALPLTLACMAAGLLPVQPISVVPTAGIFIGNAMTAATLAGRRSFESLRERRGEVEAALSIGLPDREARLMVTRAASGLALVPSIDTSRTVGLVTLPGAFVGTLLGGATPLEAAALQLLVLVGIMLTQAIAAPLVMEFIARGQITQKITQKTGA